MQTAIVVRPEPGAAATAALLMAAGVPVLVWPLFTIVAVDWPVPPRGCYGAVLLTSANAVRCASSALRQSLSGVPCWCVGEATARAAQDAGFTVALTGTADAQSLLDEAVLHMDAAPAGAAKLFRVMWLTGSDRTELTVPSQLSLCTATVYRSAEVAYSPELFALTPCVALLHSQRAARRFAALAPDRSRISIVAISPAVAAAAGSGWAAIAIAPHPDDSEMVAIAVNLCMEAAR